jgi:hypothetical protein
MKRLFFPFVALLFSLQLRAQELSRPKLVVGIVVDQMRWDYLYKFYDVYKPNGGFRRLLSKGFSCDNTLVPYLPTVTACGHTCLYTGSVPAIHGITGNNFYDRLLKKEMYCCDDATVKTVGNQTVAVGQMSPRNLLTTTVTDELRLASNFRSKTIGISMKDRGAILPAGHSANAAYWYDGKTGNFVTSSYYVDQLPAWVTAFNQRNLADSFYKQNWNLALPESQYVKYCDKDSNYYESAPFEKAMRSLPYNLQGYVGKEYSRLLITPFGNDVLAEMAKAAISAEQLGNRGETDFLAVSFSSTDYIGHTFGPNSREIFDTYVRLDETIGRFLDYLDAAVGKNNYTLFLSADHAGAHVPEYLQKNRIPAGRLSDYTVKKEADSVLFARYRETGLVASYHEYDIYLDHEKIEAAKLDIAEIKKTIINQLQKRPDVIRVVDKEQMETVPEPIRKMITNGHNVRRSGDLMVINNTGVIDMGGTSGMTHGSWNTYDAHIPLVFYGWGIKPGALKRETSMTDVAATVAALLHIQMPSGCVGQVITEALK